MNLPNNNIHVIVPISGAVNKLSSMMLHLMDRHQLTITEILEEVFRLVIMTNTRVDTNLLHLHIDVNKFQSKWTAAHVSVLNGLVYEEAFEIYVRIVAVFYDELYLYIRHLVGTAYAGLCIVGVNIKRYRAMDLRPNNDGSSTAHSLLLELDIDFLPF